MDHEKIPQALDDLISDIHQLIDEEQAAPEAEEPSAEFVLPEELEPQEPAQEETEVPEEAPAPEPEPEPETEPGFHQQRWTDRQRVPKHVAKLQHNQEEAYARWLQEQEGKDPEPPPEFPEEKTKHKKWEAEEAAEDGTGKKKKRPYLIASLVLIVLTLAVAAAAVLVIPRQPKAPGEELRVRGSATVLLAGTDDSLAHTDMLMLLSMDARHRKMSIISIPRDTKVQTSDGEVALGTVYGRAGGGEEGIKALTQAVDGCIGYAPDGCLVLSRSSLVEFAYALGGIRFDLPGTVEIDGEELSAGPAVLDGEQAYQVLRRRGAQEILDLERVRLQQEFLAAVIRQCTGLDGIMKAPVLLDTISGTAQTDLNTNNLLWLARTAMSMNSSSLYTATLPGSTVGGDYYLNPERVLQTVNGYCNPYLRAITAEDLAITGP